MLERSVFPSSVHRTAFSMGGCMALLTGSGSWRKFQITVVVVAIVLKANRIFILFNAYLQHYCYC